MLPSARLVSVKPPHGGIKLEHFLICLQGNPFMRSVAERQGGYQASGLTLLLNSKYPLSLLCAAYLINIWSH